MTDLSEGGAIIKVTGVTKSYGRGAAKSIALRGIDLAVRRGDFVSIMGPSGSGKTTLLNLVAGLDVPDVGQVVVDGVDLSTLRDHELADLRLQRIGFVFQSFNLLPVLSVEANVAWPLRYAGASRATVQRRTAEVLARVQVTGCESRFPAELSGGQQQRVAIARALVTRPSLVLADEPTGNLDSHTGRMILDLLRELNQDDGVTIVMVTHNVFAATYGNRTLEMHDGRIVRDVGTPPQAPPSTEVVEQ
jgi:putative ABC transport system ATP-binding protein